MDIATKALKLTKNFILSTYEKSVLNYCKDSVCAHIIVNQHMPLITSFQPPQVHGLSQR